MSILPILFVGHTSSISLSCVRSPRSRILNLPKLMNVPRERRFSVVSAGNCSASLQYGLSCPAPASGLSIKAPSELIIVACIPLTGRNLLA